MYAEIHIWYLQLWQFEYITIRSPKLNVVKVLMISPYCKLESNAVTGLLFEHVLGSYALICTFWPKKTSTSSVARK